MNGDGLHTFVFGSCFPSLKPGEQFNFSVMRYHIWLAFAVILSCHMAPTSLSAQVSLQDSAKNGLLVRMNYLLRQSPDSIVTLAQDLEALTDNADTVFTLQVIKALTIPDAQTTDVSLLQRVYIPLLRGRFSAMATAKKEFSRLSMGRECLLNEIWELIWRLSNNETAVRACYRRCKIAAESMIAYAMDPGHLSSSYKKESSVLRHLHYIEAFLYGDDKYMREIMEHDASIETKAILSTVFTAFPEDGNYFEETRAVLEGVGDLLINGNSTTLDGLAETLVDYANKKVPESQFSHMLNCLVLAHRQLYASESTKDYIDWELKLLKHIDASLSESVKNILKVNYRRGESLNTFFELRESLKKVGRTYANYLPYDCPSIVWALNEKGQDRYRESFLDALRDLTWSYSLVDNRVSELLDNTSRELFKGYNNPVDMALKAIPYALQVAYADDDTNKGRILDILDNSLSILNNYSSTNPWKIINLAIAYYDWGMIAKSADLVERHIISNLKLLTFPINDQKKLCDDLYLSMCTARLMQALEIDKPNVINKLEREYLAHINEVEDRRDRAYLNTNYGYYLLESERFEEACATFDDCLLSVFDRPTVHSVKSLLVRCYNALEKYEQVVTIGEELEREKFVTFSQYDAFLLNSMIKGSSSPSRVQAGIKKYLSDTRRFISSFLLEFSSESRQELMEVLRRSHIAIPISTNREEISPLLSSLQYDWALLTKTLLLKTDKTIDKYLSHHPDLAVRERFSQWQHLCAEADKLVMEGASKGDINYIRVQKYFAEKDLTGVIRSGDISLDGLSRYLSISWKDVQKKLKKKEAALEIVHAPDNSYYALLIRPGFKAPKYIHLCYGSELQKGSLRERRVYSNRVVSMELYKSLWAPIEEYIKDADRVYYSIDGDLHRFNLEAFYSEDGILASDKFNLFRLSSTGELCFPHSKELQTALLWGGLEYNLSAGFKSGFFDKPGERNWVNLPQTKEEVDSIACVLSSTMDFVRVISGPDGDEDSFKSQSSQGRNLLVFSTHGFYSPSPSSLDPMLRSGIVFSRSPGQSDPEDGLLYAKEIATHNLTDVSLVVMSACQTALGDISPDGVFGLQRGFKMAGAGGIVMTLWEVNSEESRDFMLDFFDGMSKGLDRQQSFRNARNHLKKEHPLGDWAAFIMID